MQLNKLKGEDQVNLKINLFKAVLPAYMAKTLNVKRMFCVCKDGIDRGGMTAVMTSLFFKYFNFENSGFTRRSDTCEKDVFQDLKVVISAAIAKGRDVNVHKKGFEQLSSILESKLSSEESQHICAPNQPDHLYDHDAPRSMSNRKKTSF